VQRQLAFADVLVAQALKIVSPAASKAIEQRMCGDQPNVPRAAHSSNAVCDDSDPGGGFELERA